MPTIIFPFKRNFMGIQVRIPSKDGLWAVTSQDSFGDRSIELTNVADLSKLPGQSQRVHRVSVEVLENMIRDPDLLFFMPEDHQLRTFTIFGHKSTDVTRLNEDEIAYMDAAGLTLIVDSIHRISWFGVLLDEEDPQPDLPRFRKIMAVEFNMGKLDLRIHRVDFSSKS